MLKYVELNNFRCHEKYKIDLKPETTQITGENGCGKTSVLEAIYICLRGKSFRAVDREILKRGTDFYRVELGLNTGEKIVVAYEAETAKKNFLIKDKKTARLPKNSKYPVTLFLPEDLNLVGTSPTKKRDYFDRVIAQINPNYSTVLSRYEKTLKQRNELLKKCLNDGRRISSDDLFAWDMMLARYGVEIQKNRAEMINLLNADLNNKYRSIAQNDDNVRIVYDSYTGEVGESGYLRLLTLDLERDTLTGRTNFGVHKDNYEFLFNDAPADGSASRGETRSLILALKFVESVEIMKKLGVRPIVLLDDVFSELDSNRQKCLVENFRENQVVITSVEKA